MFLMNTHNICFHGEKKNISALGWKQKCLIWSYGQLLIFFSIKSFPISGDFYHLLITLANSLDPDQVDKLLLSESKLWWYSWKIVFSKS